jgi:beta-glucosidase
MCKIVEPGDVEVWIASHVAAAAQIGRSDSSTGGAIVSGKRNGGRTLPGTATARAIVTIAGEPYKVGNSDARQVSWRQLGAEPQRSPQVATVASSSLASR